MTKYEDLKAWLRGGNLPVVVTAIVLAIPASYLAWGRLREGFAPGFLLLLSLGVGVPRLYDYWPRTYGAPLAVAWTVVACAIVAVEFVGVYVLLFDLVGPGIAVVVAFVGVDLGNILLVTAVTGGLAEDATHN